MAKQTIQVGSVANDGTGDKLRAAFTKVNANFDELYDGFRKTITADAYLLRAADSGYDLIFTNVGGCTLTVPAGLGSTFRVKLVVSGSSADTLIVMSSATLVQSYNDGIELPPKSIGELYATAVDTFILSGPVVEGGS